MIKFLWDICVPISFTKFLMQKENFNIISETNLTYQKANKIVLDYLSDDYSGEKLSQLQFKIAEKFTLIHYIYSALYAKIYNRINNFGIKRKNDFDFQFNQWRKERITKIKSPSNYVNRTPNENEQKPTNDKNLIKRKMLEEKLEENTKAMKRLKKSKSVDNK